MDLAPVQGLASLEADGRLTVKAAVQVFKVSAAMVKGVPVFSSGEKTINVRTQTCDLKDVQVFDTKGDQVDKKQLPKLLKKETLAMVTWEQVVDPQHLRLPREGTLIFVLPEPPHGGGGGSSSSGSSSSGGSNSSGASKPK